MANTKSFAFRPYNFSNNDFSAVDGEIELCSSAFIRTDGAMTAAPSLKTLNTVEEGTVVAVHHDRVIIYHDGRLFWADAGQSVISADDMHLIEATPQPGDFAFLDQLMVMTSADGLHYYRWCAWGYTALPQLPPLPDIEFGLHKAGEIPVIADLDMPAGYIADGPGASGTHPSAEASHDSRSRINDAALGLCVIGQRYVQARGMFTSPFFIRYGLRLASGRYAAISAPVLMLPTVLPPCVSVTNINTDGDTATIRLSLSDANYFRLKYRILDNLPTAWRDIIQSVDIFMSPQISTFDSSISGGLCSYADVISAVNDGSTARGRRAADTSAGCVFDGHYSLDGVTYKDHMLPDAHCSRRAWLVNPNHRLCESIATESRFFRIASMPVSALVTSDDFVPLEIESTLIEDVVSHYELKETDISEQVFPDSVYAFNGQLIAAGGKRPVPKAYNLRSSQAFSGSVHTQISEDVEIITLSKTSDATHRAIVNCQGPTPAISEAFPRYIYHPDPDAYMMFIRSGGAIYRLPLTRHEHLPGSYWFGGLDADHTPMTVTPGALPGDVADGDFVRCHNHIIVSSQSDPHAFSVDSDISVGSGAIMAVTTATNAPSPGLFGKYPMYAFSTDGIWSLLYDTDSQRISGAQIVSPLVATSAMAITQAGADVVFATDDGLYRLSGATVSPLLAQSALTGGFDISSLPRAPCIADLRHHEMSLRGCRLAYSQHLNTVIIADADGANACFYCLSTNQALTMPLVITSVPASSTHDYLLSQSDLGVIDLASKGCLQLVTRPLKIDKDFSLKTPRCVTIWSTAPPAAVRMAVYGSVHPDRWQLINSSACHRAEMPGNAPWRFLRLVISVPVTHPAYIYGASIEYRSQQA